MKNLFCFAFICILVFNLKSQEINRIKLGINTGLTYSNIVGERIPKSHGSNEFASGFTFGLNADYLLNKKIVIETGFDFLENANKCYFLNSAIKYEGNSEQITFDEKNGIEAKYIDYYIKNTWLGGYRFGKKFQFIILAGGYWAIYVKSKVQGKSFMFLDSSTYAEMTIPYPLHIGYNESNYEMTYKGANSPVDFGLVTGYEFELV
jgi:hypothetical protein